jgi:ribosomal protein S18 acetylase RimI-like enzyme
MIANRNTALLCVVVRSYHSTIARREVSSVRRVRGTVLTIEPGKVRDDWVELLALADEEAPLRAALQQGVLYGVVDTETGRRQGAVLVLDRGDGSAELRAVAVAEAEQSHGLGSWMVAEICTKLRAAGVQRVVVGTASSGLRQLGFYQRLGFRLTRVEPDFFTQARGYPRGLAENGIPTRDMVWMERDA